MPQNNPDITADDMHAFAPEFLNFYEKELYHINPATFRFLNQEQRQALMAKFTRFYALLQAQNHLYLRESLRNMEWVCSYYYFLLTNLSVGESSPSESPIKYLGLDIAQDLAAQIDEIADGKVESAISFFRKVNARRSATRYSNGLVSYALGFLVQVDSDNKHLLSGSNVFAGYVSWIVYYILFGLNLYLLLKHSIAGSWMNSEEKAIPPRSRWNTQWQQRKFALLNDFFIQLKYLFIKLRFKFCLTPEHNKYIKN